MDEGAPTLNDETSDNNLLAWCVHYYFPSRLGLCDSWNKIGGWLHLLGKGGLSCLCDVMSRVTLLTYLLG